LIAGDLDHAQALLANGKKARVQVDEQDLLSEFATSPSRSLRTKKFLQRFDRFFGRIRDPRNKVPKGSERVRLQLATIRDKFLISQDGSIDWKRVIDSLAGAPLSVADEPPIDRQANPPPPVIPIEAAPRPFTRVPIWIKDQPEPTISLTDGLKKLSVCGIRLKETSGMGELKRQFKRKAPWPQLLASLGNESATNEGACLSDDIWHFDVESFEDAESYSLLAQRMSELAGDALPLENIDAGFNSDGELVLSFRLGKKTHHWNMKIDDDWLDLSILERFAKLLEIGRSGKSFTIHWDGSTQDWLIGCSMPAQLKRLRQTTGLNFRPLKGVF
jgi:hypothetical protein